MSAREAAQPSVHRRPVRPGPGSYRLLDWVARLGASGIEPAGLALGLTRSVTYSHARRLIDAGLMWRVPIHDGQGGVVAVTRRGAADSRERGISAVTPRSQAPCSGVHARAVSWDVARAELKDWPWLGPATLTDDERWTVRRDDRARHRPDLGFTHPGGFVAVEVELHAKAPDRLRAILWAYRLKIQMGELKAVTYVVDKPYVDRLVKREMSGAFLRSGEASVGPLRGVIKIAREGRASVEEET